MQTKYGKYNYNGYSPQFVGNKMCFKKRIFRPTYFNCTKRRNINNIINCDEVNLNGNEHILNLTHAFIVT